LNRQIQKVIEIMAGVIAGMITAYALAGVDLAIFVGIFTVALFSYYAK